MIGKEQKRKEEVPRASISVLGTHQSPLMLLIAIISVMAYNKLLLIPNMQVLEDVAAAAAAAGSDVSRRPDQSSETADQDQLWGLLDNGGVCTFDIVNIRDLTVEMLNTTYRLHKPLLIKFDNGTRDWTKPEEWDLSRLAKLHGESLFDNYNAFPEGVDSQPLTLEFARARDTEVHYKFDSGLFADSSLPDTVTTPAVFRPVFNDTKSSMFIGHKFSTVSYHIHPMAWAGLVSGRKKWYVCAEDETPLGGSPQMMPLEQWVTEIYANKRHAKHEQLYECIQEAGDIVVVPEFFHHAVLNMSPVIGIGGQNRQIVSPFGKFHTEWTEIINLLQSETKRGATLSTAGVKVLSEKFTSEGKQAFNGRQPVWSSQTQVENLSVSREQRVARYSNLLKREPDSVKLRAELVSELVEMRMFDEAERQVKVLLEQCKNCLVTYLAQEQLLLARSAPRSEVYAFRKRFGPKLRTDDRIKKRIIAQLANDAVSMGEQIRDEQVFWEELLHKM